MIDDQFPMTCILPTAYLPPIQYFSKFLLFDEILIEQYEHFPKQTYRNRCVIYGPNGSLNLSIPLYKRSERTLTKDIQISYDYNWQMLHWRSLESAYRSSPFFEFYEDGFKPFYKKKYKYLIELNNELLFLMLKTLKLRNPINFTSEYKKEYGNDFRSIISPKQDFSVDKQFLTKPYTQVFCNRHEFLPNLSIVDLLFNEGPRAIDYF